MPVAASDVNVDGLVNVDDILGAMESWGPCACLNNLTGDGVDDLLSVLEHWSIGG